MTYDPRQPRDWHGRWTDDDTITRDPGAGDEVQEARDIDDLFPERFDDKSPECRAEWDYAIKHCGTLMFFGRLRRGSAFGRNMKKCVYGMVSEACGGNKIDKGGPNKPGGKK